MTPLDPLTINPHKDGLPIETIFAPREIAFKISEPVLIPPSKIIILFLTAFRISLRTSIEAIPESKERPPWFDTQIALAPHLKLFFASSVFIIPLIIIGSLVIFLNQIISFQFKELIFCKGGPGLVFLPCFLASYLSSLV